MTIDTACLLYARPENVERLARALRVPLPPRPADDPALLRWRRQAAQKIVDALEAEKHVEVPW